MKPLSEMTLRELVDHAKSGPHYLSWGVVCEFERRLPEIEAAAALAKAVRYNYADSRQREIIAAYRADKERRERREDA